MEKILWIMFFIILIVLLILLFKIINNKGKSKINIVVFIFLLIYFVYSFFTTNGSARLSITLYGHPIIAYTTGFNDDFIRNEESNNKKYLLPTKRLDDLSSFFECKSYGPIRITTYYGF